MAFICSSVGNCARHSIRKKPQGITAVPESAPLADDVDRYEDKELVPPTICQSCDVAENIAPCTMEANQNSTDKPMQLPCYCYKDLRAQSLSQKHTWE
jgi:hypothetical protein